MPHLKYNLDEISSVTVDPGRYRARLERCEQVLSKSSGQPMLTWYWKIVVDPYKGKEIRSFTSLLDTALTGLKEHLMAFNLKGVVELDTSSLVGRYVILIVDARTVENKGVVRELSGVTGVLPDVKKARKVVVEEPEEEEEEEEEEEYEDEDEEEIDDVEDEDDDVDEEDEDEDEEDEEEEAPPARSQPSKKRPTRKVQRRAVQEKLPF